MITYDENCPLCQGSGIMWFMTSENEADHEACECGRARVEQRKGGSDEMPTVQ